MFCNSCGATNPDGANFCSTCGKNITSIDTQLVTSNDSEIKNTSINDDEKINEFASDVYSYIKGSLATEVENKFCQVVKAKTFGDVLSNVYVSKKAILVTPSSKDRSGFALAGIILTGGAGAIGVLGMHAGNAIGKLFSNEQSTDAENIQKKLEDVLIFNTSNLKIKAYDYRRDWDFAGGEWQTRVSIEGESIFNGKSGVSELVFAFEGKTFERSFLTKANNKVPELCDILGVPVPSIKKETKFIW